MNRFSQCVSPDYSRATDERRESDIAHRTTLPFRIAGSVLSRATPNPTGVEPLATPADPQTTERIRSHRFLSSEFR